MQNKYLYYKKETNGHIGSYKGSCFIKLDTTFWTYSRLPFLRICEVWAASS